MTFEVGSHGELFTAADTTFDYPPRRNYAGERIRRQVRTYGEHAQTIVYFNASAALCELLVSYHSPQKIERRHELRRQLKTPRAHAL